jgi:hypothetical protein
MFGDDMKMFVDDITFKHETFQLNTEKEGKFQCSKFSCCPAVSAIPYVAAFERHKIVSHVELF